MLNFFFSAPYPGEVPILWYLTLMTPMVEERPSCETQAQNMEYSDISVHAYNVICSYLPWCQELDCSDVFISKKSRIRIRMYCNLPNRLNGFVDFYDTQ